MGTEKYDIRRALKALYTAPTEDFVAVDVPPMQYLAVDGHGDPNTSEAYQDAVEALYSVAYTVKFDSKKTLNRDFVVGPLEGTWRADDMAAFTARKKSDWDWTMMISQPEWITGDAVDAAVKKTAAKKKLPALPLLRRAELTEGQSVQILHIGSYDDEGPTLARLHDEYLPSHGLVPSADHHEINLSDPRRTPPEKLKTILRQPVAPRNASTRLMSNSAASGRYDGSVLSAK